MKKMPIWARALGACVTAFALLSAWALFLELDRRGAAKAQARTASAVAEVATAPRVVPIGERLSEEETLAGAVSLLQSHFEDSAGGKPPRSARLLANWGATRMRWLDIGALPRTTYRLVMKDSAAERGKHICVRARIIEIAADRSSRNVVYTGGLSFDAGGVDGFIRFAAVGSTGELVEGDHASFCGVVTGRHTYIDTRGAEIHAIFVVGMFGLPDNISSSPQSR